MFCTANTSHTHRLQSCYVTLSCASRVPFPNELVPNEFTKERSDPKTYRIKNRTIILLFCFSRLAFGIQSNSHRRVHQGAEATPGCNASNIFPEISHTLIPLSLFLGLCPESLSIAKSCWKVIDNGFVRNTQYSYWQYDINVSMRPFGCSQFNIIYIMRHCKWGAQDFWDRDIISAALRLDRWLSCREIALLRFGDTKSIEEL